MVKGATACRAGLIEPISFWMSLLITTVAMNLLASQALAHTKGTVGWLQDAVSAGTSAKPLTTAGVNEVAQSTLERADSDEASPSPTAEVSPVSDLGEITSPEDPPLAPP